MNYDYSNHTKGISGSAKLTQGRIEKLKQFVLSYPQKSEELGLGLDWSHGYPAFTLDDLELFLVLCYKERVSVYELCKILRSLGAGKVTIKVDGKFVKRWLLANENARSSGAPVAPQDEELRF